MHHLKVFFKESKIQLILSSSQNQTNLPAKIQEIEPKLVLGLQDEICAGLEKIDGEGKFLEESWKDQRVVVALKSLERWKNL